jgi:hypothetical protein
MLNRALVPAGTLDRAANVSLQLASFALRMPVVPPVPASAYPPPPRPPRDDNILAGVRPTPRLIEYVPPMLPPPR